MPLASQVSSFDRILLMSTAAWAACSSVDANAEVVCTPPIIVTSVRANCTNRTNQLPIEVFFKTSTVRFHTHSLASLELSLYGLEIKVISELAHALGDESKKATDERSLFYFVARFTELKPWLGFKPEHVLHIEKAGFMCR
jgi:hypothetical protein